MQEVYDFHTKFVKPSGRKPVNIRIAFFFVSQIVFVTGQGQHKISILFA